MTDVAGLPAEWEPQAGVLIAWPHRGTDWAARLPRIERAYVGLASAIARFEPLLVCTADAPLRAHAAALLDRAGVDAARVRYVDMQPLPRNRHGDRDSSGSNLVVRTGPVPVRPLKGSPGVHLESAERLPVGDRGRIRIERPARNPDRGKPAFIPRHDVDHAPHRIAAVERSCGSPKNFDLLDLIEGDRQVEVEMPGLSIANARPIDQNQDLLEG